MSKFVCAFLLLAAVCCASSVHAAMQLPADHAKQHHASLTSAPSVTSLSVGTRPGARAMQAPSQRLVPAAHEEAAHEELVDDEVASFLQQRSSDHPMSRTSSPFLHEIKSAAVAAAAAGSADGSAVTAAASADADVDLSLDDELMVRVEGAETAKEIRDKLKPYLHPQTHATLQAEPLPPLVSQAKQRALRTAHMKHVLEMKYNKQHAHRAAMGAHAVADATADSTARNVTSVTQHVVQKSVEDDRAYRFITLDNGLRAVLVSDPNTTKAAAAIDVGNGYLSDPSELPGLAHFLEHMLFLGTDKYPSEAGYADFIESHGGFSNAYTAMENTNYYFDILPNHLVGALDRFAQFFIAPKLSEDSTGREAGAVDQEHMKNLQSDAWRTNRLLQDVASRSHPYSKFGTGCRRTLSVKPRAEMVAALRKFWSSHYTAGNLILSVLGSESLDVLQATVDKYFSPIKPSPASGNFNPLAGTSYREVFNSSVMGSELFVNTVEDSKFLALIFPLESQFPSYRKQSLSYLRGLLEQRGTNSLLKQLKARGWSTGIQLGIDAGTTSFATIQFSVDLTTKGGEHIDEIVALFFASMEFIGRTGVEEWRYKEMSVISNLTFTYKDKEQPSGYISKLASNLRHYPPEDLLVGGKLFLEYDAQDIKGLIKSMNPRNMMLMLGGKELNHEMKFKEQWYGIEYDVVKIDEKRVKRWVRASEGKSKSIKRNGWAFALPPKSSFIPSKLSVAPPLPTPVPRPIILYESARNESEISGAKRLWYSEDLEFHRPHGHVVMRMYVPSIYSSARNYLLTNIYSNLLEDQMDEDLYAALVAGFSAHFRVGTCYLDLIFYGYNSGLVGYGESIARIMNPAKGFRPDKLRFEVYKETLLNSYLNKKYDAPHKQSSVLLNTLLDPKVISQYDLVRTLEQIQFEDVVSWPKVLFGDMSLESYVHGNVSPRAARKLLKIFVQNLPFRTTSASFVNVPTRNHYLPRPRLGQVREDVAVQMYASNPSETNSAIVKYWQFGMGGVEGKLYSELLSLIAQKPIFHQLRTKEQLGYIVWSSADNRLDVSGFKVQVQSGRKSAAYLNDRIDAFILDFQNTLLNMTQAQFEVYVETLMMSKLQSPVSMAVQTAWFWQEISKQEYIFQRKEIELYLLNATQIVNRQGFQNFVQKLFYISDERNPGVQSCETRGGGALSVRVESPNPRPAVAAVAGAPNPALPVDPKIAESKIVGTVRAVPRPGGKAKKKAVPTTPKSKTPLIEAKKAPKLHKPIIIAEAQSTADSASTLAATAVPSTGTKSLLEHGQALDADASAEAEAESETAAMQRELDSLDQEEASLDADLGELDGDVAVASFIELDSEAELDDEVAVSFIELGTGVDAPATPPKAKRQFIKGAGPFAEAPKAGKALSVASLDQTVLIQTRTRDGSLYQLNATQSALHVYTDSLMLYPRGRYEPPPQVKDLATSVPETESNGKSGKQVKGGNQGQAKVKAAVVPPMAAKNTKAKAKAKPAKRRGRIAKKIKQA